MAQARAWCFTVNNPAFPVDELPHVDHERYVVWQLEKGENGTLHIQGYIELDRPTRLTALKTWLPTAHFEVRRGTREQARDYCMKADTREVDCGPYERGEFSRGGSGKRNDLADAVEALKEGGIKKVARDHPSAYVKFSKGLKELARELEEQPTDDDFDPKYWQSLVLAQLSMPADDRTIMWITDTQGGKGKSRLARHLILEHNAVQLEGRIQDMAYQYNKEPIVIFDITRAASEHTDHLYTMAEKLKNGIVTSTKYESCTKIFKPPHVIFFANMSWNREKWTNDRVQEMDLSNPYMQDWMF